jgi:ADP-heptose:LPS heptosyltransferase
MKLGTVLKLDKYLGSLLVALFKPATCLLGLFARRDHSLKLKKNLTILKPLGGGSLAIAYPTLLGLRKRYPDLPIRLVTTRKTAPFARSLNLFDEIFEIDDSSIIGLALSSLTSFYSTLGTDTIIDLEAYSNLSTVFALLTCSRNRLGFYMDGAFWRRGIATHLFYFNRYAGTFEMYDKILKPFNVAPASRQECCDRLIRGLPEKEQQAKYRISIGHGCSDLGKERMLSAQQWEQVLASRIDANRETEVAFLGADKDAALAKEIIQRVSAGMPQVEFSDFCGKTSLAESLSIMRSSDEFWGIDSSLIHYARLFDLKSVSFWGPTDPETRLREFPGIREEVLYEKIPCSPCVHIVETLPCGGDNICIRRLFEDAKPDWIGMVT